MKIAYLHGLESEIDQNDPKIIFLNQNFSEVYTPQINYRAINVFGNINSFIKAMKPDLIVGSSMGGYFAYLIGSKLKIPTLLFNPAVIGRSMEPQVDASGLRGTKHSVFFGKSDSVISGVSVREYFNENGVGDFKYEYYNGGHRVPVDVFIDSISKIANIYSKNKSKDMARVKMYEEFVNEAKEFTREELMNLLETKYKIQTVRTTEEFNGETGGIWVAGDNGEELSGNKMFDYYNSSAKYQDGVLKQLRNAVEKKGWRFSWNDPGTMMIWPNN